MSIMLSHAGTAMSKAAAAPRELIVATMDGVQTLKKTAAGAWELASTALAGKHIQSIIEAPGGTLFACAYRDGVYASEDGGATWSARDQGISIRNVYSLAAATVDGKVRLYAGTEPPHLFTSDDMGRSWRELPGFRKVAGIDKWTFVAEPFKGHAKHIGFDPNDPRVMYVCVEVGALLKSTDGGETWTSLPIPNPDMHRTVIDPRDSRRLYTTGGAGLLQTLDDGQTWRPLLARMSNPVGEYADQLVRSQANPDVMLLGATQFSPRTWIDRKYAGTAIAKSVDGGETWRILRGGLPERITASIEAMTQVETPQGIEYFFGTTDGEIWHGDQDGERWACIAKVAPVSKCIHQEMLTGKPVTQLVHADGQRRPVHAPSA
jgi:photosystem II stability/assembly factor-like uncharacterized protein